MKATIPVYDICTVSDGHQHPDLLTERLGSYLKKNYQRVHQQHGHSFYHLVLFTGGSGSHTLDFTRYAVEPWQLYFMTPGQVHSWHFGPETEGYVVHFSTAFFRSFLANPDYLDRFPFFSGQSPDQVMEVPEKLRNAIQSVFEQILQAGADNEPDLVRALLLQLFLETDRHIARDGEPGVPQQKQLVLRNFMALINRHYRSLRLPREYAEQLYITPNHLNALCQDLLGKTAGEVIRERVLLEAKRLLTNEQKTVAEIAGELNFPDNSYFSRFFRKYVGQSPEEFRKSLN